MSKKRKIITIIIFGLFLCSTIGNMLVFTSKPDLYYPATTSEERNSYGFFENDFNTAWAMRLYSDGDCSAGYGDFVAMHLSYSYYVQADGFDIIDDEEYLTVLAEKIAEQGAKVVVYTVNPYYSGTLYIKKGNQIGQIPIFEDTAAEFSKRLSQYADRPLAVPLCWSSVLSFAAMILYVLLSKKRVKGNASDTDGFLKEDGLTAIEILSKRKYRISVLAAGFMFVGTLAWLIEPYIYMLTQHYFGKGEFIASLVSLPFFVGSIVALLNLTVFQKYRRWINNVCLAVVGSAFAVLLLSLVLFFVLEF